ncbi:MAG: Rossmann-like domain-containing protein [Anaerovoracaceae bacterium]
MIDQLIQQALAEGGELKTVDVRAGLGYTAVLLEGERCGLAYTFRSEMGGGCGILDIAGKLVGIEAKEIIPWARDSHRLKAALGLAAINAVFNDPLREWEKGNVLTAFHLKKTETFGMIGMFPPILEKIKTMTENIYVFEQEVAPGSELYPSSSIPQYLPKCDVVVVTATTLINQTFHQVSRHLKNAREVCLVGPSTPLCPDLMGEHGITLLAGSVVKDPNRALEIISQGGGTMALKPAMDQVLVRT